MKRTFLVVAVVFLAMVVSGCGGGDGNRGPSLVSVDIPSVDGFFDGDITYDPLLTTYTVTTLDNVYVGTYPNPLNSNPIYDTDSKGYLTFSLAQIPAGASIQGARILLRINDVTVDTGSSVSVLPEMVSFNALNVLTGPQISNLFNNAVILSSTVSYDVFPADIGADVSIDVTDALIEAGQSSFSTLQIKLTGSFGRIIIDNIDLPPVLQVDYII